MTDSFSERYFETIRVIDAISEKVGRLVAWSMLFLVFSISYECFSRYLLGSPTKWVFDTNYMVNGSAFMLGCGYALLKGAHVRTDMLWEKFSERKKGWIDFTSYVCLFFPAMLALFVISVDDAWESFLISETSEQTAWKPLMWPFRSAVPVAALLLMFQGVSETMKSWFQIRTGREFEHRGKIEV